MPNESQQTFYGIANKITNLVAASSKVVGQDSQPQDCNKRESRPIEGDSANPQPITLPETPITSIASKNAQEAWASIQVQNIQTEIQTLNGDTAKRTNIVALIDQDLGKMQEEYDKHLQNKSQDLARVIGEVKEQYNRKLEILESKVTTLKESKQNELDRLKSNAREVSRKETGLVCYKAVINYLKKEGNGSN